MKKYTIELDATVSHWLEHIAEATGETVERIISNGIYNQVAKLEESVSTNFSYNE